MMKRNLGDSLRSIRPDRREQEMMLRALVHNLMLKQQEDEDRFADTRGLKSKTREMTDDGFYIYSDAEMKVGQGGDTDQCPFDCDCCF